MSGDEVREIQERQAWMISISPEGIHNSGEGWRQWEKAVGRAAHRGQIETTIVTRIIKQSE
jgi:hypothetical protein